MALKELGVVRYQAKENAGFPDRFEMRDAFPDKNVLLLNHVCQLEETPLKASHAFFVREGANETYDSIDEIPPAMKTRLQSLRGLNEEHMMIEADVVEGRSVTELIEHLFSNPDIAYIHAHKAALRVELTAFKSDGVFQSPQTFTGQSFSQKITLDGYCSSSLSVAEAGVGESCEICS